MRALLVILIAALVAVAAFDFLAPGPAGMAEPRVLAHYMPWFRAERAPDGSMRWDHWQWFGKGTKHDPDDVGPDGRRDIASVFYPLIGPYHGPDAKVLEYHVLSARAAGIDAFVADWYGPGTYSDEVFAALRAQAEPLGFRVAICLEEKSFFPGYAAVTSRVEVLDEMERHIRHVLEAHAGSPAYLRRDGRPVLFMFNGHGAGPLGEGTLSPAELADVLGRFSNAPVFLVRGHVDTNYLGVVDGAYAWCGDAAYRRWFEEASSGPRGDGRLSYRVGVASPGFDDSGVNGWGAGPRVTDRRGTQEYEDNWADVLKGRPDAVQIVTWNDFQEGTTVEPTVEYGFTLLNLTERYVRDFTGRPSSYEDNQWGYRIYRVRERLEAAGDVEAARRLAARADRFVGDFVGGSRLLMGWRLRWLERAAEALETETAGDPK